MNRCPIRSGFFVLRDCHQLPMHACMSCGRVVCTGHTSFGEEGTVCVECQGARPAASGKAEEEDQDNVHDSSFDDTSFAYSYRSRFYGESHYRPIYTGHHPDSRYNEYDVRSFDEPGADAEQDEGDSGAGFGDS